MLILEILELRSYAQVRDQVLQAEERDDRVISPMADLVREIRSRVQRAQLAAFD
jgi:hypothetical protein